jgi:hypothetical protein
VTVGGDRYHHPNSVTEVAELIDRAKRTGQKLRVRGAIHSVDPAVFADSADGSGPGMNLLLDRIDQLEIDRASGRAVVGAGRHLGADRWDPAGTATLERSLFWHLDQNGLGLPDMGGITHQTVGGFLSTGSAGGSLSHSIYDSVIALKLVDGKGTLRTFRRDAGGAESGNPFFGAVIAMGLLGVITEVTFQAVPRYHVIGSERTLGIGAADLDLFGDGPKGLRAYLQQAEHSRLMWWPQRRVHKVVVWEARKMEPADYTPQTGGPDSFTPHPYELLDRILGSRSAPQWLASKVFRFFGRLNPPPPATGLGRVFDRVLTPLYPWVVNAFLRSTSAKATVRFWDDWWRALPMDNEVSDDFLPTEFTELWIPLSKTSEVMLALRDLYARGGMDATGTYACEIYAAKRSPMWLSPAYGEDVVRIDLFWFAKNEGDPARDYYPRFWNLLAPFQPRYHWGKHLPVDPALRGRYPRWDDFLRLREECDPDRVFLTDYWAQRLGLA